MNALRRYALRTGVGIIMVMVYFYAWRPLRTALTRQIVTPVVLKHQTKSYQAAPNGVAITVIFPWHHEKKKIHYRPQAGLFFLICLLTFVMTSAEWKWYCLLAALHLIATVITVILMLSSVNGWYSGFILVDFIGRYLVPALSLGLAAWVLMGEKRMSSMQVARKR